MYRYDLAALKERYADSNYDRDTHAERAYSKFGQCDSAYIRAHRCEACQEGVATVHDYLGEPLLIDYPARPGGELVLEGTKFHTARAVKFDASKHEGWRRYRKHVHG